MTIDHLGVGVRVLEVACGTDHGDSAVAYSDGGVTQDAGVAHFLSPSRSGRTGARYDLGCVHEEKVFHNLVIREFRDVKENAMQSITATEDYRPGASSVAV